MKRYSKILAVVFSLLLVVLMIPVLPETVYADDPPAAQVTDPKATELENQEPVPPLTREARRLERIFSEMKTPAPTGGSDMKGPVALAELEISTLNPAACTYLYVWLRDSNDNYLDPNDYTCTWYYESGSGWATLTEIPSDIGEHIILVPGYANGKRIKVDAVPKDTSQYTGSCSVTTNKVKSAQLNALELYALGTGFYVGNEIQASAIYKAEGKAFYIDDAYIHFDYYVGEGNSWTQIPQGDYNWYSYIPFEAEGKFIKVIAYVMAEQDDVIGGPLTYITDERTWILPMDEYFHDETVPSGWITMDMDGDGLAWEAMTDTTYLSLSGDDGLCISSASWTLETGSLKPDNWLISPAIHVPPNATLRWYTTASFAPDYYEHYDVYVSDDVGLDITTWDHVFGETLSSANNYTQKSVYLNEYAGKDIHIAFRHHDCTDQLRLLLDGVHLETSIIRVAGKTRYDTAIDIANRYLSIHAMTRFPLIFVTTGDNFPDALSGSSLSISYDAPVLLISPKVEAYQEKVLNYIENHIADGGGVVLLGGTGAVPQAFEDKLNSMVADPSCPLGFVDRVSGTDRYLTNLEILDIVYNHSPGQYLLVCDGTNYADAATSSAIGLPVMLVGKTGLTQEQKDFLNSQGKKYIFVIGGEGAVTPAVFDQLKAFDAMGTPRRVWGMNRAETAAAVADTFASQFSSYNVVIAYGGNFPDCIAGGLLAYTVSAPILYGDSKSPKPYLDADLPYFGDNPLINRAYVLGGPSLVSDDFVGTLMAKG